MAKIADALRRLVGGSLFEVMAQVEDGLEHLAAKPGERVVRTENDISYKKKKYNIEVIVTRK